MTLFVRSGWREGGGGGYKVYSYVMSKFTLTVKGVLENGKKYKTLTNTVLEYSIFGLML